MPRLVIVLSIWLLPMALCLPGDFKIYWNVPTDNCHKFGLNFALIHDKYKIIQNTHDTVNGDRVAILYRPGLYPYLKTEEDKSVTEINGGVPQAVNLEEHLVAFEKDVNDVILPNFSGYGIISYEDWRPLLHQNRGGYKKLSISRTPKTLKADEREDLAKKEFEEKGKAFMLATMQHAKKLRPNAQWSYHDYHNCFNFKYQKDDASCPPKDEKDNDNLAWLWQSQDFMNPLMWVGASWDKSRAMHRIAMTTNEARRIVKKHHPEAKVIPYLTLSPEGGKYIKEDIAVSIFKKMIDHEADGVFIWEKSDDFTTKEQCLNYLNYMTDVFGLAASNALSYVKTQRGKSPYLSSGNATADDVSNVTSSTNCDDIMMMEKMQCEPCRDSSHPTCQPLHIIFMFIFVCALLKL